MAEVIYISCPLCGMSRVLEKTGASAIARGRIIDQVKGRIHFDHMDLDNAFIVQVRERKSGKEPNKRVGRGGGTGFQLQSGFTLEQMKDKPEYSDLVEQLKVSANHILSVLAG